MYIGIHVNGNILQKEVHNKKTSVRASRFNASCIVSLEGRFIYLCKSLSPKLKHTVEK